MTQSTRLYTMLTLAALCFVVQTTPTPAQEPPAAIGPSIVKVRYGDGEDQWVWGTVVLDESGDHPTSCMVVVPEAYGAPEDIAPSSEMIDERLLKRAKARYEHATVIAGEWEQPAVFVDYLPMLAAAVLEVKHPPSTLPPVTWSEDWIRQTQAVVVHHGPQQPARAGIVALGDPEHSFPWRVTLHDGTRPEAGAPVMDSRGHLLGIVKHLTDAEADAAHIDPKEDRSGLSVLVPAAYLKTLLLVPAPGSIEADRFRTLVVGAAVGAEGTRAEGALQWTNTGLPASDGAAPDPDSVDLRPGPVGPAPPADTKEMRIYALRHLSTMEALVVITWLEGARVRATAAPNGRGIIAVAAPEEQDVIQELLSTLDVEPPATWPGQEEFQSGLESNVSADDQALQASKWLSAFNSQYSFPEGVIRLFELKHIAPRATVSTLVSLLGLRPGDPYALDGDARGDEDDQRRMRPVFVFLPSRPVLIVRASAEDLQQIEAIIEQLDEPNADEEAAGTPGTTLSDAVGGPTSDESVQVVVFALKNRPAEEVVAELQRLKPTMVPPVNFSVKAINDRTIELTGSGRAQRYIGKLIQQLDVVQNSVTGSVDRFPIADSAETEQLRIAYAEHNARLRALAEEARRDAAADRDRTAPERQPALQQAVAEAFEARQQLQRAELAALESRIAAMRRTLEAREQIKDQIIQRRVEELLNPALEWETPETTGQAGIGAAIAGTASDTASPIGLAGSPNLPTRGRQPVTSPYSNSEVGASERLYQGRTESEWQRLFSAETDAIAKLDAAIALLNLSAPLPPEQQFERILAVGSELVQWKYGEQPLEFAFESLPPQRWSILGDEQRKAYLRFHSEVLRICESLPAAVMAAELADALDSTSVPRAACGLSLLTYTVQTRVAGDAQASRLLLERLGRVDTASGDDFAYLKLFAKVYVSASANDEELATLADEIVAACQAVRTGSTPAAGFEFPPRFWLISLRLPDALLQDPRVTRALAEVIADDVVVRGRMTAHILQTHLSLPPTATDLQSQVDAVRSTCGPALPGWLSVANDHLKQHRAPPFTDADRAMLQGTYRAINLYSDGDEWPAAETAELLTELLRAAYTDDPAATVNQPVSELLPASPLRLLSSIVTLTGEIPDFVKTGTPRSADVAEKLAALDQLLAGEVTGRRADELTAKVSGLLGEAPVEAVQRVIAASTRNEANVILGPGNQRLEYFLSSSSHLNPEAPKPLAGSGFGGGGFFPQPTPALEPIDALLLLAILAEMTGADREQDARIASLEAVDIGGVFRWQIQNLIASNLQSRHHASRMLREMAAKTESPELLDMIRAIDPSAMP